METLGATCGDANARVEKNGAQIQSYRSQSFHGSANLLTNPLKVYPQVRSNIPNNLKLYFV